MGPNIWDGKIEFLNIIIHNRGEKWLQMLCNKSKILSPLLLFEYKQSN